MPKSQKVSYQDRSPGRSLDLLIQDIRPSPMPESTNLMLCTPIEEPFDDPAWIFETKLDGLRVLCHFDGAEVYLYSRNGNRQDFQFPEIVSALKRSLKYPALLDGEIVCFDEKGVSSFKELQQRLHIEDAKMVDARVKKHPAYLCLFDVLYIDQFDVTRLPLFKRKDLLKDSARWNERIRLIEFTQTNGKEFFQRACRTNEEGLVAKKLSGTYVGTRGGDWVKIKCTQRQEFVIVGYTEPKGSRIHLGALLVAYYSDDGRDLIYAGKVGTGFDRESLGDLKQRLEEIPAEKSMLREHPSLETNAHWVKPQLIAEIEYASWTHYGILRHARFEGLRFDKDPQEVKKERSQHLVPQSSKVASLAQFRKKKASGAEAKKALLQGLEFTSEDKIIFPDKAITKGEVLSYYQEIAEHILPYLKDRPLTLERIPEGLVGENSPHFWQKNTPSYYPDWFVRAPLLSVAGKIVRYAIVNDLKSLLYLVNQGALSFHIWASTTLDLDHPNFVLFDLDPGQSPFVNLIELTQTLKGILDGQRIAAFLKTSGRSELHILTLWNKDQGDHDAARNWAIDIATQLVKACPRLATLERSKEKREKKIYVDVIQNAKGHHFVPPYTLRAVPQATVSIPLTWDELNFQLHPEHFDLRAALKRIRRMGVDPMKELLKEKD